MLHLSCPAPWQQRGKVSDLVFVEAGEHVGEPSLRIDIVELGRLDQYLNFT